MLPRCGAPDLRAIPQAVAHLRRRARPLPTQSVDGVLVRVSAICILTVAKVG